MPRKGENHPSAVPRRMARRCADDKLIGKFYDMMATFAFTQPELVVFCIDEFVVTMLCWAKSVCAALMTRTNDATLPK
jgi:hypothetical protein